MRGPLTAVVVAIAVLAVVSSLPRPSTEAGPLDRSPSVVAPLSTDVVALPRGAVATPLSPSSEVSVTFTLTNPHAAALGRALAAIEDPSSPAYRHFLSYAQLVQQFSPPVGELRSVEAVLAGAGARDITATPDRMSLAALLPAASVDRLLGIQLVSFGEFGRQPLYTALGTATLPPNLGGLVSGIGGLSDTATAALAAAEIAHTAPRPLVHDASEFVSDPALHQNWFIGSDFTQAYGATRLLPGAGSVAHATFPTGVSVATLLVSAYNQSINADLPPWDPAVIDAYFNGSLGPGWPTSSLTGVPVTAGGATPPLPGSYGGENDTTEYEVENSLDLEMAGNLAPGAPLYNFYISASLLGQSTTEGSAADYLAADLAQALSYNYGSSPLAVVSCSFGLPDLNDSAWNAELLLAAGMGVTIVAASGDQGNAPDSYSGRVGGQWPDWPASAASNLSGAISVGGVTIGLSGSPTSTYNGSALNLSYDAAEGPISEATAWYDTLAGPGSYAGSEGGASSVFPEPWWQFDSAAQPTIVNATVTQGANALGRSEPDVAMPANTTIATISANATGAIFFTVLEGTSIAAPVLAGLLADVVAVERNSSLLGSTGGLGFIDPEIYALGSFYQVIPGGGTNPFTDITTGSNFVFSAGPGWDPITGWGEVMAPAFLASDENVTLRGYHYTGPTPGLPVLPPSSGGGSIPWFVIYAIFGAGIVVAVVLVVLAARPRPPKSYAGGVPAGAQWGTPMAQYPSPGRPGATFLCPYCGAIRPAEPVRCPQCGAY